MLVGKDDLKEGVRNRESLCGSAGSFPPDTRAHGEAGRWPRAQQTLKRTRHWAQDGRQDVLSCALQQLYKNLLDIRLDVPIYLLAPKPDAFARLDAYDDKNAHRAEVLARLAEVLLANPSKSLAVGC